MSAAAIFCLEEGCGRSFTTKGGLGIHKSRTHKKKILLFPCTVQGCGQGFQHQAGLNFHLNLSHKINKQQSAKHERVVVDDNDGDALMCEIEGCYEDSRETFQSWKALAMHLGYKHQIWRCTKGCEGEFRTPDDLRKHRMNVHGVGNPAELGKHKDPFAVLGFVDDVSKNMPPQDNRPKGLSGVSDAEENTAVKSEPEFGEESHAWRSVNNSMTGNKNPLPAEENEEISLSHVVGEKLKENHSSPTVAPNHSRGDRRGRGGMTISTPVHDRTLTSRTTRTTLGATRYAQMAILQNNDPKPIRRALPKNQQLRRYHFSDDEEEDEIDYGDGASDSESEHGSESSFDSQDVRPRKRPRSSKAVQPDDSETDTSEDGSSSPVPRPQIMPTVSKTAQRKDAANNPYEHMPALQFASAADFRRHLLFGRGRTFAQRQEELDAAEPRGHVHDELDMDAGLFFPHPRANESKQEKKLRLQSYVLLKARIPKPLDVRMVFSGGTEDPDNEAMQAPAAPNTIIAAVQDNEAGNVGNAKSAAGPRSARVSKRGKVMKFGSRTRLGEYKQKRKYDWKDPAKNQKKAEAQAALLAAAIAEGRAIAPAPVSKKNSAASKKRKRASISSRQRR